MWLNLVQFVLSQETHAAQAVLPAAFVECLQAGKLVFIDGHDDFPANVVRDGAGPAEFDHLPDAAHRQASLLGARPVVKSGMQDSAVVSTLMLADAPFLLEHRH